MLERLDTKEEEYARELKEELAVLQENRIPIQDALAAAQKRLDNFLARHSSSYSRRKRYIQDVDRNQALLDAHDQKIAKKEEEIEQKRLSLQKPTKMKGRIILRERRASSLIKRKPSKGTRRLLLDWMVF